MVDLNNEMNFLEVVNLCKVLGDLTRFCIVDLLNKRDMYTYEIQQELDIYDEDVELRTLSRHLRIMEQAGLVHSTTNWTHKKYSLNCDRLKQFMEYFKREIQVDKGTFAHKIRPSECAEIAV